MSIRIETTSEAAQTVLKVAGWLRAEDVGELTRVFRTAQGPTALDLSELQSADPDGVEMLRGLIALGAEIQGASPYIKLLLRPQT